MNRWIPYVLLAVLWTTLNGADVRSWIVGGPAVLAGGWIANRLGTGERWRLSAAGLARFMVFFLVESTRGGWDVARRAVSPRMPLRPGIVCYPVRLPAGAARVFFYGVISLLPGTAVVRVDENQVCVHALEAVSEESSGALRVLEDRVAAVFGVVLEGRR